MARTALAVSEGQKFSGDANLTVVDCPSCHVTYAIPTSFDRSARKYNSATASNYWTIHCPFGHEWHYTGRDETQIAKRDAERARNAAARARAERDQAQADARAQKAAKTRFKNDRDRERRRTAAGVCPCCNRTFKQLRRHMASQHPEHVAGS